MDNYAITVVNFGRGKTSNFRVEPAPTWRRPAVGRHPDMVEAFRMETAPTWRRPALGRHLDMVMTLKSLHLRENCPQSLESGKMDAAVST